MRGARLAAFALMLAGAAVACGRGRARFAPPADPPEVPGGEGWFCFHATTPHRISLCKREREACEKSLARMRADKTEVEEVPAAEEVPAQPPAPARFERVRATEPAEEGEGEARPADQQGEGESICAIDPASCPVMPQTRRSVPAYSSCAARPSAVCSAYYHEFNFWRRDQENQWHYQCAETAADCNAWRDLWHLHLVKRACETVP